jgi:hypothetical protein
VPYNFSGGKIGNNFSIIETVDNGPPHSLVIFAMLSKRATFRKRCLASRYRSPQSAAAALTLKTSSAAACLRVHRAAIGDQSLLRGRATNIYAIADGTYRSLAFCLCPCKVADITAVMSVLANRLLSRQFLADQVYDARAFRRRLAERGAHAR